MDLTNKFEVKALLKKYNSKPEKHLGQHFILLKGALKKMIDAAEIKKTDTIIEVGPGLGTLTQELAKNPACRQANGAKIIAIEKDPLMVDILKETVANYKNVKIIQADASHFSVSDSDSESDTEGFGDKMRINRGRKEKERNHGYKIVANLPYNVATFLIRKWLESEKPPKTMILMIQKEVAQRIVAKPPRSNLLGLSVQFYADAEIINYVKKELFWPKPKVDAAIIKIVPRKKPPVVNREIFFKVLKAGFSQPRKQLMGNLSKKLKVSREELALIFRNLDISDKIRAENLSLSHWQNLARRLIHN